MGEGEIGANILLSYAGMIIFEERTVWEFFLGQRGFRNHFGTAAAEAAV